MRLLAGARVDSIVYGGTSVSFLTGNRNSDGVLLQRMQSEASGIPCTTTTTAVVRALHAMNVRRIAVATPYNPEIDARLASYFEAVGFEVVSIKGEGIEDPWEICTRPPESIYAFVQSAESFGSGGGIRELRGLPGRSGDGGAGGGPAQAGYRRHPSVVLGCKKPRRNQDPNQGIRNFASGALSTSSRHRMDSSRWDNREPTGGKHGHFVTQCNSKEDLER